MSSVDASNPSHIYLGIDLGWTTGWTGLATVDEQGRFLNSGRVRSDLEIADWIQSQQEHVSVVAVDAPLIVPNETGQRLPERLIGKSFGGFGASAHTSNRAKFGGQDPRAQRLAVQFGWQTHPHAATTSGTTVCIEVYPHPAMVGLFALGYRIDYKKGNDARRLPGFLELAGHLESIPELRLSSSEKWSHIRRILASPSPGDLTRLEDELDAIFCSHLAWLWHHRRDSLYVYGSHEDGYIVATPPPTHRPARPTPPAPPEIGVAETLSISRQVPGRPTGYAAEDNEQRWKAAVRTAFAGCSMPTDARLSISMDFVLSPEQCAHNEPDLDNLIKSTIDALDGVIGLRPRYRGLPQADDVRVDRITASKRLASNAEVGGAHITVSAM